MFKKLLGFIKKKDKKPVTGGGPIICFSCNKPAVTKCKEESCHFAFCADCAKHFLDENGLCFEHSMQERGECKKCGKTFFTEWLMECSECQDLFCLDCLGKDVNEKNLSLLHKCSAPGCFKTVCSCVEKNQQCADCGKRFCGECAPKFLDPRTCDVCDDEGKRQAIHCKECGEEKSLFTKCANPECKKHICHLHLETICRDCTPKQKNNVS